MSDQKLLQFIKEGAGSWAIGIVLDKLLDVVISLDNLDKKIDRLLKSPLTRAQRAFRMAKSHEINGELSEYKEELKRARILFDEAAELAEPMIKLHMLYMAGMCCDLLDQKTKKDEYYRDAVKVIKKLEQEEYRKRKQIEDIKVGATNIALTFTEGTGTLYAGIIAGGFLLGPVGMLLGAGVTTSYLVNHRLDSYDREAFAEGIFSGDSLFSQHKPAKIWAEKVKPLNINVEELYQSLNDGLEH